MRYKEYQRAVYHTFKQFIMKEMEQEGEEEIDSKIIKILKIIEIVNILL